MAEHCCNAECRPPTTTFFDMQLSKQARPSTFALTFTRSLCVRSCVSFRPSRGLCLSLCACLFVSLCLPVCPCFFLVWLCGAVLNCTVCVNVCHLFCDFVCLGMCVCVCLFHVSSIVRSSCFLSLTVEVHMPTSSSS